MLFALPLAAATAAGGADLLEIFRMAQSSDAVYAAARATWAAGIAEFCKGGAAAFRTWLNDRGVANIKALNSILERAYPWHDMYGGMDIIEVVETQAVA